MPSEENVLILTVGLPRSGKSTWSRSTGLPIVNPDSIRLAMHGKAFRPESEPLVWGIASTMVRALFLAGHREVILDATGVTAESRRRWACGDWRVMAKSFPATVDECCQRALATARPDLIPVIHRMAGQYEAPTELAAYHGR